MKGGGEGGESREGGWGGTQNRQQGDWVRAGRGCGGMRTDDGAASGQGSVTQGRHSREFRT